MVLAFTYRMRTYSHDAYDETPHFFDPIDYPTRDCTVVREVRQETNREEAFHNEKLLRAIQYKHQEVPPPRVRLKCSWLEGFVLL